MAAAASEIVAAAAAKSGHNTISVFRSRRRQAFLGGDPAAKGTSSHTFTFEQLLGVLSAFCSIALCSVGDVTAKMTGLPIGGFLSNVACSMALCRAEAAWASGRDALEADNFVPPGAAWENAVACVRYVDDSLMCSCLLCRQCLLEVLGRIYPVSFEPTEASRVQAWLDMAVDSSTLSNDWLLRKFDTPPAGALAGRATCTCKGAV